MQHIEEHQLPLRNMELARFKSEFHRRPDNPVVSLTLTITSRIIDRIVAAADASMVQVRNEVM